MITAKSLRIKGLRVSEPSTNSTVSKRLLEDSNMIPKLLLHYDETVDSSEIIESNIPIKKIKSQVEVILESLELFPDSGLAGGVIYSFVKNYYKGENMRIPERDTIHSALHRLVKNGSLLRVKRDMVWWYKLAS